MQRTGQWILIAVLAVGLTACSAFGIGPGNGLVRRAIAQQLNQTQQTLIQELDIDGQSTTQPRPVAPKFRIGWLAIDQREAFSVQQLPTYRLRGRYNLLLTESNRMVQQKQNAFEVYLQRQSQGKTWRLLRPEVEQTPKGQVWHSYLLQ